MQVKKILISGITAASLIGVFSANVFASTSSKSDTNRTWTYGKSSSTIAVSNLLDNVATHDSMVFNNTTGASSGEIDAPVHTTSYAKIGTTASNSMTYYSSVAYWTSVTSSK